MSQESIHLIDANDSLRRRPYHNQNQAQYLTRAVWRYLTKDSRQKVEVAAEDIGDFLEVTQDHPPRPTRVIRRPKEVVPERLVP